MQRAPIKHYLITLSLSAQVHMHGYLMCDDKRYIEAAYKRMFDEAEKIGFKPLPLILQTDLSTGADMVRKIVGELSEEAKRDMETATDYHFSCWTMTADHPLDGPLMELH